MPAGIHDGQGTTPGADGNATLLVAGRYCLDRPLARGSQLTTWAALDHSESDRPPVIVRLFRHRADAADARERAFDGQVAARHGRPLPGLPDLVELGWEDDRRFVVFAQPRGEALAVIPQERIAALAREDRLRIARQLVAAVHALHESGFMHLDLSPENVILDLGRGEAHLRDWGYMVPMHRPTTTVPAPADLAGAGHAFASAELLAGSTADPRDDVYAIACLAYQIISGAHPYRGRPAQKAAALGWRPQPLRALNTHQHGLLMRALAFERSSRVVRLDELAAALGDDESTSRASTLASSTGIRASRVAMMGVLAVAAAWAGYEATTAMAARPAMQAMRPVTFVATSEELRDPAHVRPLRRAEHLTPDAVAADLNRRIFATPRAPGPETARSQARPAAAAMTTAFVRDPS